MPPRQTTGCARPACPTSRMQDAKAERVILRDLMNHPLEAAAECDAAGLTRSDFYHDPYGRLYDTCRFLIAGPARSCHSLDLFREVVRRGDLPYYADTRTLLAFFITGIALEEPWLDDAPRWWPADAKTVAAAASAKVVWLASRRAMYYKAQELIRDALDPVGGADENFNRV